MTAHKGQRNAHTLLGRSEIPRENQIRGLLDPVSPALVVLVLQHGLATLEHPRQLAAFRSWQKRLLVVLAGTPSFSSQKSSCPPCSPQQHPNGTLTSSPRVRPPGVVAPGQAQVIPLPPEFLGPPEGPEGQAWENAAANRWLRTEAQYSRAHGVPILGEDLSSNHPMCGVLGAARRSFILVCKPDPPPPLSEERAGRESGTDLHQGTHRYHPPSGVTLHTSR
jgi:hypothetical protein